MAGSLLGRVGVIDAVALWPTALRPTVALDMGDRTSQAWMRPLLPARARAVGRHPRAWQSARARALVVSRGKPTPVLAAERALHRELLEPRVSLYSSSEYAGKVICFVSELRASAPTVVVKAMAQRSDGWWLRREVGNLAAVRARVSAVTAEGLLPPPLLAQELEGEYLVVEAYGGFDRSCERSPAARDRAHRWLRGFQRSTTRARRAWSGSDSDRALATVAQGWRLLRPAAAEEIVAATRAALEPLHGRAVPRCSVHGDFSPCNLAEKRGQLKVLDWEWARMEGLPCFDLWCYQLAELQWHLARRGALSLDAQLEGALSFVEGELRRAGIEPAFALATLPAALAELVARVRRTLGRPGSWERAGPQLMAAVERALSAHERNRALAR